MVYAVDKLMKETRKLAAEFYATTGKTLPVTAELAKFDAMTLLGLQEPTKPSPGVDVQDSRGKFYQVKGRVIFKPDLRGYRVGQLNIQGQWDATLLLLYNPDYACFSIYGVEHQAILDAVNLITNPNRRKRGALSIGHFKRLGTPLWSSLEGINPSQSIIASAPLSK